MKTTRRCVEDAMKENREDRILLGGDFNERIGEREARKWEEKRGDGKRNFKDKVENVENAAKRLMEWIEENGWEVLNEKKEGDKEGKCTYINRRGEIVIYYGIVN
jgi:transposase